MPTISMADVNAAADAEYESVVISGVPGGDVTLLPVTRLSNEKREALFALDGGGTKKTPAKKAASRSGSPAKKAAAQKDADEAQQVAETVKTISQYQELLKIIAATEDDGQRLVDHLNGDVARLAFIVAEWSKSTQPGEAQPSSS